LRVRTPQRMFAGQRPDVPPPQRRGLEALADVLLGGPSPAPAAAVPADRAAPPRGLYAIVPAGIEPSDRRRVGLAVARRLVSPSRPSVVFLFDHDRAEAHLVGEAACGRGGPPLPVSDPARAVSDLLGRYEQVGVVLLEVPDGMPSDFGAAVRRAVFVAAPGAESLVETYRGVKSWHAGAAAVPLSLFVVGTEGSTGADHVRRRLTEATRAFLGCDVAEQGFMSGEPAANHAESQSVLESAPAADVWPLLTAAARSTSPAPVTAPTVVAPPPPPPPVAPPVSAPPLPRSADRELTPAEGPAFALWTPPDRAVLLAAVEAQVPALIGERLRTILRIDIHEPGAPSLAAVCDDGSLVAIVLRASGAAADAAAAARWLAVHRSLLVLAYPSAGIKDREPSAIVLEPFEPPPAASDVRRFLAVRTGGRHGIVLLP